MDRWQQDTLRGANGLFATRQMGGANGLLATK